MSSRTIELTETLYQYLLSVSVREHEALRQLREETLALPMGRMQISPEQGQLLGVLIGALGAAKCLEVGVFTGYSSLAVALALPAEGRITACDISEEWTAIARRYWRQAGVDEKIDLHLAPALQTLDYLIQHGAAGSYDFAFIDADKENYWDYYERALTLLRSGGLIAVDNTLWDGRPADPKENDADTQAIRAFNERLSNDRRVRISLVPIGDGLTLIHKPQS